MVVAITAWPASLAWSSLLVHIQVSWQIVATFVGTPWTRVVSGYAAGLGGGGAQSLQHVPDVTAPKVVTKPGLEAGCH